MINTNFPYFDKKKYFICIFILLCLDLTPKYDVEAGKFVFYDVIDTSVLTLKCTSSAKVHW